MSGPRKIDSNEKSGIEVVLNIENEVASSKMSREEFALLAEKMAKKVDEGTDVVVKIGPDANVKSLISNSFEIAFSMYSSSSPAVFNANQSRKPRQSDMSGVALEETKKPTVGMRKS